jgi:hypothetical protein
VGRDGLKDDFDVLVTRVQRGAGDKGLLVTGLRGVGKTVLLNQFKTIAERREAVVVFQEVAKQEGSFPIRFASLCRRALLDVSPRDRWKQRAQDAARIIKSFSLTVDPNGAVSLGFDVDAAAGVADSGDLVLDLTDVIVALGRAASDHGRTVVFLLDEIQYLTSSELSALIMAKHQVNQQGLPIVFSGAGLPQLPALTGEAQSYAERMFTFPEIGKLNEAEAKEALVSPASKLNVSYTSGAVHHILDYTDGYPYFVQEFGKAVWNFATGPSITVRDAREADQFVEEVLDQDFFSVRADSLPDGELSYVKGLAALGPGSHSAKSIAAQLGRSSSSTIGTAAARLIERGLVYRTKRGQFAFTVPHFERYVQRAFP